MFIDRAMTKTLRRSEGRNETRLVLVNLEFRPSDRRPEGRVRVRCYKHLTPAG